MRFPTALDFMVFLVLASVPLQAAGDDPIYQNCLRQAEDPPPWCYQREVERIGDPALCENILTYWPKAEGVHGQCCYQLALKNRDCALCNRIKDAAIRKMCRLDACPAPQKRRD